MAKDIITLIANTGVQIIKRDSTLTNNQVNLGNVGFYEKIDFEQEKIVLEYAIYLPDEDIWVPKIQLKREGFYPDDQLAENINLNRLKILDDEKETYRISNIEAIFKLSENKWLPIPFFQKTNYGVTTAGPTNWARLKIIPISEGENSITYRFVLAFDTKTANDKEYPQELSESEQAEFALCENDDLLLKFCDEPSHFRWVSEYLKEQLSSSSNADFPQLKHLAQYIYLIKYLAKGNILPKVILCSEKGESYVNVDLVTDIGNSNTCAILFENYEGNETFKFDKVKKLQMNDLSNHEFTYNQDFSTRLAFARADFGEMYAGEEKFQWPSILRLGNEAKRLINESRILSPMGSETVTNYSSPKRYLWDSSFSSKQWEFIRTKANQDLKFDGIFVNGISQQFTKYGEFTNSPDGIGISTNFSRQSLMTFAFIEIFAHAIVQINSVEFRHDHGQFDKLRKLRRVIVTCPTAMVQKEQVQLRKAAENASLAIQRFFEGSFEIEFDVRTTPINTSVVPSSKNVALDLSRLNDRNDWLYDESTCCQLVFLYAEIAKRYLNKTDKFFNLYGKSLNPGDDKSLTIGSIDIGGGTSDLMICNYTYSGTGITVIKPEPLYWESFNLAGDELLKEIIRNIIIEGELETDAIDAGHIRHFARSINITDIEEKINNFFGSNTANINYEARQFRKSFNVQISIPLANKLLEHGANSEPDRILTFDELFANQMPNQSLLDFFKHHFGFDFKDIKWNFSRKKINAIISLKFENLLNQVASIFHLYHCDFILLAGKPTSLKRIQELFIKFLPVTPDRIISLNKYRVGRWYPFADANGYFENPKSIVAVGALISQMGSTSDKLGGFRINLDNLKSKVISTADYIGIYDSETNEVTRILLDSTTSTVQLTVPALPLRFGFKKLKSPKYPSRPHYELDFDQEYLLNKIRTKNEENGNADIQQLAESFKTRLKTKMPFTITIERAYNEDKETLFMTNIVDANNEEISSKYFGLKLKTIKEEESYWLDSGEFNLGIGN